MYNFLKTNIENTDLIQKIKSSGMEFEGFFPDPAMMYSYRAKDISFPIFITYRAEGFFGTKNIGYIVLNNTIIAKGKDIAELYFWVQKQVNKCIEKEMEEGRSKDISIAKSLLKSFIDK